MRVVRGLGGALLWIVASVVALLAIVLCVTVILLPLGIPLLMVAKRLFGQAVGLMLPRGLTHPVDEGRKKTRGLADKTSRAINKADKAGKRGDKKIGELAKGGGEKVRRLARGKKKSRLPWRR